MPCCPAQRLGRKGVARLVTCRWAAVAGVCGAPRPKIVRHAQRPALAKAFQASPASFRACKLASRTVDRATVCSQDAERWQLFGARHSVRQDTCGGRLLGIGPARCQYRPAYVAIARPGSREGYATEQYAALELSKASPARGPLIRLRSHERSVVPGAAGFRLM